ncbi:MAG: TetR/AcrR family transcriptional regulator [Bacteroidales bacterium]|nr:TetR/AcrR family transcriptional regulator [Bacteroidales bacterium]
MDDIASELRISKKTLYLHFKSKKDIINTLVQETINQFKIKFKKTSNLDSDSFERLYDIYYLLIDLWGEVNSMNYWNFKKYYPDLHADFINTIDLIVGDVAESIIIEGIWDGFIEPSINIRKFDRIVRKSIQEFYFDKIMIDTPNSPNEMLFYMLRSVTTSLGLSRIDEIKQNKRRISEEVF